MRTHIRTKKDLHILMDTFRLPGWIMHGLAATILCGAITTTAVNIAEYGIAKSNLQVEEALKGREHVRRIAEHEMQEIKSSPWRLYGYGLEKAAEDYLKR